MEAPPAISNNGTGMLKRLNFSWLNTPAIVRAFAIAAIICALIQLALGASFSILFFCLCSIAAGLFGFWLFGINNLAGWVSLSYLMGNILIAFYAKTILGQALDSNLYAPFTSFLTEAICCVALLCALVVATWINVGANIRPITDLATLRFLSLSCFLIGIIINFFHWYIDRGTSGGSQYGGLNVFSGLMYFGIVCGTARVILCSDRRRCIDITTFTMLVLATAAGLMENARSETALPSLYFFTTILFFKGKLPWRYVVLLVSGALVFIAITPLILFFRYNGFRNKTFTEELNAFANVAPLLLNGDQLLFNTGHLGHGRGYYDYFGNNEGQVILGRFSSIQQSDPAIAATNATKPMGNDIIISGLRFVLPSFIDPGKPKQTNAFIILARQGWTSARQGAYPTLPLAGEIYSAYGMAGIIFIPFLIFLIYLLVLKKVGWGISGNVLSIFIFSFGVLYIYDATFSSFLSTSLRDIPLICITVLLLMKTFQFLVRHKDINLPNS